MAVEEEVRLSERISVVVSPLNALESLQADDYMGTAVSEAKANKVYAICSIRKVKTPSDADYVAVNPLRSKIEFGALAQRIDMGELMKLSMEVSRITAESFDETLKNELTALQSDSSQQQ